MLDQIQQTNLLDIRGVCRSFSKGSGEDLLVLEKVDLTIRSGVKSSVCSGVPDRASRRCCASSLA